MTLTIHLPPEAEERLREKATREGQEADIVAAAVLVEALEREAEDRLETIEGIRRGAEDFAAGRYRSFGEFAEEQRRKYHLPPTT